MTRLLYRLNLLLAACLAVSALAGMFWPPVYAREHPAWAAMGKAGEAGNLVAAPLLVVLAWLARRGSLAARLVWMGTLVFLIYGFVLYCFFVHFNSMFLLWCAILGLSFYLLVGSLPGLQPRVFPRAPARTTAVVFTLFTLALVVQYLIELIPASLANQAPPSVAAMGNFAVNPAHVLDLCFLIPAFVICTVWLVRRKPAAFVLAPVLLAFNTAMSASLVIMLASLANYQAAVFLAVLTTLFGGLLIWFLRAPQKEIPV